MTMDEEDTQDTADLAARIAALRSEHRDLDDAIAQLSDNASVNQVQLQRMKKRKLAIKDQLARLENLILPDIIA